jgi:hypothetical protein
MAIHSAEPLDVVVGWMDAVRRGDLDEVKRWLDPDVTWRGVRDAAICRGRDEVLEMLRGSLKRRLGVLGAKVPGLAEIRRRRAPGPALQRLPGRLRADHRGRGLRSSRAGARGGGREGAAMGIAPPAPDAIVECACDATCLRGGPGLRPGVADGCCRHAAAPAVTGSDTGAPQPPSHQRLSRSRTGSLGARVRLARPPRCRPRARRRRSGPARSRCGAGRWGARP